MKNKTIQTIATVCLFEAIAAGLVASPVWASTDDPAIKTLLEQASYWHEKSNDQLAIESLNKVLMVDTNNPQALYLMALWAEQRGDSAEAAKWRERLEKAHPTSSQAQQLRSSEQLQQFPQSQLALARRYASTGKIKEALATWETLFEGELPPVSLAPEYYITMAGDRSLYPKAVKKLKEFSKRYADNTSINIAYAKVLTHRSGTRRQGIDVLQKLASTQKEADSYLRQALLWLNPSMSDEKYYSNWMKRHPEDSDILNYFKQKVGGGVKKAGFDELNRGNLSAAKKAFERVLKTNPEDADALAGLGYVYLHQGNYADAAKYLNRSAKKGGKQARNRRSQAKEAEFYARLENAKKAYKQGDITRALELSSPLATWSGEPGETAKLFRADLLRQNGDYFHSERVLREVLKLNPESSEASEQLYYVLLEQNENEKAQAIFDLMPKDLQQKVKSEDSYGSIRELAEMAINTGNTETAVVILKNGVERLPNNSWLRLELARLLEKQGKQTEAEKVMAHLYRSDANSEQVYAAALYARDHDNWKRVSTLLARIPEESRDDKIRALDAEAGFNIKLLLANNYLSQSDKEKALSILKKISGDVLDNPYNAGKLAVLMMKCGDISSAVDLVKQSISQGIQGNAGYYADHVAVLYRAGLKAEAQSLLNDPLLKANSTELQLARARSVYVINEADRLRELGGYAQAYDILTQALQIDPHNSDLMLAMGRLYQSGKMNEKAEIVYDYLLDNKLDTAEQDARVGAINVALANDDVVKAHELAAELKDIESPDRLLLMARIYEADGDHKQALASLREARGKLLGMHADYESTSPMQGGLVLADNPFNSKNDSYNAVDSQSVYGSTMPWQVAGLKEQGDISDSNRIDLPEKSPEQTTLNQVNKLLVQLTKETSTWVQGGIAVRGRDGESGLSQLSEAKVPLEWSTVPFGNSRFSVNLTAVSLDAGTSSTDGSRRFGTGALIQGESAESEGLSTLDGDTLPDVDSQGAQSESGVEVAMALESDNYKLDIGTTPLGLEKNTLVGGAKWSPRIDNFLTLSLSGERRVVTDSLLSYAGIVDEYSGDFWGQVTKNGLNLQLNYDDGDAGFYANLGGWKYLGTNVADNESIEFGAGMYARPYVAKGREFRAGVDVGYKDFSENLGYFSYGHGGYFSPQNYISISFPLEYRQEFSDMSLLVGTSVGYQSYSLDSSAYFPDDADLQAELENYVSSGYAEEAYYSGDSVSGIGYNFHAALEYEIQRNMTLEARVFYDTFGEYSESSGQIMLRRSYSEY